MLSIRNANLSDIPAIRVLSQQTWPDTYGEILTPEQLIYMLDMMYSDESLKEQMEKGQQFLLCLENDIPVGFASFSETESRIWKLHKIYVLPNQQGKGIGKKLVDHIIEIIRPQHAKALQLNVNRHNKAKSFYERLGFTIIRDEDINIGNGYYMNDYVMELPL